MSTTITETRVCRLYGQGDLRLETDTVRAPGPGEVQVAVKAGGICGSDLHYFQDGGFGPIRVREPIILGHEAAGVVAMLGNGVTGLTVGQTVAINPSRPCGHCRFCREGHPNHCLEMRFFGSAMRMPHEQGAFRDHITVDAAQCVPLGADRSPAEGACAEPLAVCLHAANRAGDLEGKRVLVTGAGPIGALSTAVARHCGAAEIVVTDLQDHALSVARAMGATTTVNVAAEPERMEAYTADKGSFDVAFECSAAAPAIAQAIACVRPLGRIVQVGVSGNQPVPINALVGKEIEFVGTHRFHAEFAEAVDLIDRGAIDVRPIITHSIGLDELGTAFAIAGDRSQAVKVQLRFD
ncbi:L-idonate 5-dehydrogenase [Aurantimonas sp. MSK8Z-1]|uniref:L-idonate 5-dehydrogenase n=1 Tax=Mangrovibrevibacter kandeliae TaxID=2968473 RepID=UPI0021182A6F|nr:L-idonate 5-dehydrogenase [Aurantimonas sp. MSK8Z-1]MCW4114301.1 L-idonate 5-dehydrogenase [Aurantimonas sp. MSK8Z-1]